MFCVWITKQPTHASFLKELIGVTLWGRRFAQTAVP